VVQLVSEEKTAENSKTNLLRRVTAPNLQL
jgi:hypothetical protein